MNTDTGSPLDPAMTAPSQGGVESGDVQGEAGNAGSVGEGKPAALTGFQAHLGAELKGNTEFLEKLGTSDLNELAKGYVDQKARLDSALIIPGENATEQEVETFREKLGIPKAPTDYGLKDLKDLPDFGEASEVVLDPTWFQEMAHTANLRGKQAEYLYRAMAEKTKETLAASEKARVESIKASETELRKAHGENYETVVKEAADLVAQFGDKDMIDFLDESGKTNDPRWIAMFAKLRSVISDDAIPVPRPGVNTSDSPGALGYDYSGWNPEKK